jgi:6-phosphogluconolactonase
VTTDVRVCEDADDLAQRAAGAVAAAITGAVQANGQCTVALAGGDTPRALYATLAARFNESLPWKHVHVFWGDERFVPSGDRRRNQAMARETLLDHVPCPPANIHPVSTDALSSDAAAAEYEATLRRWFSSEWPLFDLVLLGLGADGHTASLFPGSSALDETTRWAVAATAPADPPSRVTLTLPVFNNAALTLFLVAGAEKAPALRRVLAGADASILPAAGVRPSRGAVVWWVDRAAAP